MLEDRRTMHDENWRSLGMGQASDVAGQRDENQGWQMAPAWKRESKGRLLMSRTLT